MGRGAYTVHVCTHVHTILGEKSAFPHADPTLYYGPGVEQFDGPAQSLRTAHRRMYSYHASRNAARAEAAVAEDLRRPGALVQHPRPRILL